MDIKKYNNLITSGRRSKKVPKDSQILALVVMPQKIANDYNTPSLKPSVESTKVETAYIRDIPPCMLEETKGGVGHKFNDDK